MANTIGSVSIEVMADMANFISDLGKAQEANTAVTRKIAEDWQNSLDTVTDTAKGLIAAVGVGLSFEGIKSAVDQVTTLDTSVASLSATFGISVGAFSDLNAAATVADSNLENVTSQMTHLQQAASKAVSGNAQMAEGFRALGISVADLQSLTPDQLLQRVATSLIETAPSAERTANAMQLFGRNIAGLYPVLQQLTQGAHDTAVAFGAVITPDMTAKSEAYSQSIGHVKLAVQGLEQTFVQNVLPALTQAANEFAGMISTSSSIQSALQAAGVSAQFLADHLDGIVESAKTLGEIALDVKIAGWTSAMFTLYEKTTGVTAALAAVGTAAMTAVSLGAAAFTGWQLGTWARENFAWVAQIGNWIGGGVAAAQVSVVAAFQAIWTAVKASFQAFVATIQSGLASPFDALATKLQNIAPGLSIDFRNIANSIKPATDATDLLAAGMASIRSVGATTAATLQNVFGSMSSDARDAGAAVDAMNNFKATVQQVDAEAARGKLSNDEYENSLQALSKAYVAAKATGGDADTTAKLYSQTISILGASLDRTSTAQSTFDSNTKAASAAQKAWAADQQKLTDLQSVFTSQLTGPEAAALDKYNKQIDLIAKAYQDAYDAHKLTADVEAQLIELSGEATDAYEKEVAAMKEKNDLADQLIQKLRDEGVALQYVGTAQQAVTDVDKIAQQAMKSGHDLYGVAIADSNARAAAIAREKPGLEAATQAELDHNAALKQAEADMKAWVGVFSSGFDSVAKSVADFATGTIKSWHAFGQSLIADAKTFIAEIIAEFLKLTIIRSIMGSLFGAYSGVAGVGGTGSIGGSLLGIGTSTAENGIMSSMFGGSSDSWMSNVLGSTGGSGSGIMGFLFGSSGGFNMLGDSTGLVGMGASDALGIVPDYAGLAGDAGDVGSVLGTGADGATSGLLGSGGNVAGGLSAAGSVLGGALAGWQIGSQIGGTAGGVIGAAGLATAAYFIPVVGWIAGALALINAFTGGDVFGTQYKPTGVTGENITEGGSSASISDYVQEHKHGALFSGGKYKNVTVAATADQTNAINSAFTQIQNTVTAAATALGVTAGAIISGSWTQSTDKTGKVIANTSTVAGQQFNDTAQQFFERIAADSEEALLPASAGLTKFFNSFQSNADKLADAANMLVQAQLDINKGMGLLGKTDTDLGDIGTEVQKLAQSGETLVQAYARLQAEQEDVSSTLSELGMQTNKTGTAFVEFADQMATAAGGLSNLQTLWTNYYSAYYTGTEQAMGSLSEAYQAANTSLSAIGENVNESMAQFRTDFTNAMPNLTGAQVTQWLQAAGALAAFNTAVNNVASAVKAAEADATSLAGTLFGTPIQQLQQQIAAAAAQGLIIPGANAQLAALQAGQGQQQQLTEATQLLGDLGNIGAVTGGSLQDFAKQFGIPLDQLAKILGTNAAGLEKDFEQQVASAKSQLQIANNTALTNQLLAAINKALGGQAIAGATPTGTGTAVDVPGGSAPPGRGILPTAPATSSEINSNTAALKTNTAATVANNLTMRSVRRYLPTPRNTRGMPIYAPA